MVHFHWYFYLAVQVVDMSKSTSNEEQSMSEELSKMMEQNVKSIQDKLLALKHRATHTGLKP